MNDSSPARQDKFRRYRERKKAEGLREIRVWLPDTRLPEFKSEASRQAALLDRSEDEHEAAEMMRRLAAEAQPDWN